MEGIQENGHLSDTEDPDSRPAARDLEPWVRIQSNTFKNWVNDKLRVLDLEVEDPSHDFWDGVKLCRLMEVLKGKGIGRVIQKKKPNHYEASANLSLALDSMRADGIKLVNIGKPHTYSTRKYFSLL